MPTAPPEETRCRDRRTATRLGRVAGLAALAVLSAGLPSFAAEPDADLRRVVAEHVADLASPLRSERVRAEQALLELGPGILDLLPGPAETTDQAARVAVRQVRIRLERVAAEQSVLPSRVTLRGSLSIERVAGEIERQTGNRIELDRLASATRDRLIDVDWQKVTFWESMAQLCAAAPIGWESATDEPVIRLIEAREAATRRETGVDTSHAFRVAIDPLTHRRGTLRASLELVAEPRLRPLFVRIADADFSATAEDRPLALFSPQSVTELPMTSRGPARFAVLFREPEGTGVSSATIRGRVTVHVAAAPTDVRFDDLSGKRTAYVRRGGVGVTLKRVRLERAPDGKRGLTVQLAVTYDSGGPEFESHRTWIDHNDVRLERTDGERRAPDAGFEALRQADGGVEVQYRFSDLPDATLRDWRLVYVAPMLLTDVPLEFELDECRVTSDE